MKKIFATTCLTLVVLFAFLVLSCDRDCNVCPEEPPQAEKEYHFLYSFIGDFYHSAVLTYSTKTGEVIDSTYYGRFPFWDARFTSDGRYACYTSSDYGWATTWITEYATGDTVSVLQGIAGQQLSISHDNQYLLMSGSVTLRLFRIPLLEIVYERTQGDSWPGNAIHPFENKALVGNLSEDSLLMLDFRSGTVIDSKMPIRLFNGEPMGVSDLAFSIDGTKLILTGGPYPCCGSVIQIRDAETLEILQESGAPARIGPYLHPDGERVFFCEPWTDFYANESSLWELNLRTMLLRKIIDGGEVIGPEPHFAGFNPSDMDITPDGKYAFFISGGEGLDYGPILKFDLDTYQFVDAFYPPGGVARVIRMYPLESKK